MKEVRAEYSGDISDADGREALRMMVISATMKMITKITVMVVVTMMVIMVVQLMEYNANQSSKWNKS